jgi:hypothetical protein
MNGRSKSAQGGGGRPANGVAAAAAEHEFRHPHGATSGRIRAGIPEAGMATLVVVRLWA